MAIAARTLSRSLKIKSVGNRSTRIPPRLQERRPPRVVGLRLLLVVLTAVQLDRQAAPGRIEVEDEGTAGVLTAELHPVKASPTQDLPQRRLGVRLFLPQLPPAPER
jgi:hypothetical protein